MSNKISAYYYSFDATGDKEVDALLHAIGRAGKTFHSTSQWNDEVTYTPDGVEGRTPVEWIQNAANKLADSRKVNLPDRDLKAAETRTSSMEFDPTIGIRR